MFIFALQIQKKYFLLLKIYQKNKCSNSSETVCGRLLDQSYLGRVNFPVFMRRKKDCGEKNYPRHHPFLLKSDESSILTHFVNGSCHKLWKCENETRELSKVSGTIYLTKLDEAPANRNMFKFAENTSKYSLIKTLFSNVHVQRLWVKYFPKQEQKLTNIDKK